MRAMDGGSCNVPAGRSIFSKDCGSGSSNTLGYLVATVLIAPVVAAFLLPWVWRALGMILGWYLRRKTEGRRAHIFEVMEADEKEFEAENRDKQRPGSDDEWENVGSYMVGSVGNGEKGQKDWDGIVGFFHPFWYVAGSYWHRAETQTDVGSNAGGGGERVLWAAIRATQQRWPRAKCVVYTGDHEVNKDAMLARVQVRLSMKSWPPLSGLFADVGVSKDRFNIQLHPPTVTFLYLTTRHWVLASAWPRFTLAGQSFGSIIMAWDAFSLLVPDIFVDTMGYAFALGLSKLLFPHTPTGAYVHYPTISADMLESLDPKSATGKQGVNAGQGVGLRGLAKTIYWRLFAKLYSSVGSSVDVVMTNSSWTQAHVQELWGPLRQRKQKREPIAVVYPPVAVRELEQEVEVSEASEEKREKVLLYIAQFRPEKNHDMIAQAFSEFVQKGTEAAKGARLVFIGSVRDDSDSKRVYKYKIYVRELHIEDRVEFHLDASWPEILRWLRLASVGVNGMWNEHFGIGVVEYQAAGLIAVVHDSGGPQLDIVTDIDGKPTGFHATTPTEFADAFEKALSLPNPLEVRQRARLSAKRFTEEEFAKKWVTQMEKLVALKLS